jgi:hypothetical protein
VRSHSKKPLYVSRPSAKSFWQTYRVFADRIELRFWFVLHTLVIPMRAIEDIQARSPPVWPNGSWGDPMWFRILKLDWADFFVPVSLHKESGFFRDYRFTPDDPDAFVAAVQPLVGR